MISKPAISRVVMSLEQKGLITKKRSASDARVIELHLTDRGMDVIREVSDSFEKKTDSLRRKLGSEEFDRFIRLMDDANIIIAEELGI